MSFEHGYKSNTGCTWGYWNRSLPEARVELSVGHGSWKSRAPLDLPLLEHCMATRAAPGASILSHLQTCQLTPTRLRYHEQPQGENSAIDVVEIGHKKVLRGKLTYRFSFY